MDSKQDQVLRQRVSRNDKIAHLGGWAVLIGLAFDIIIVCFEDRPISEKLFQSLADILIASGVFAELHYGRLASDARDALRLDAEEKAAFIEKAYGWRRISPQVRDKLVHAIKRVPKELVVRIEHQSGDPEAHRLANDIGLMFKDAGVAKISLVPNAYPFQSKYGLFAVHSAELDMSSISEGFAEAGLPISVEAGDLAQLNWRVKGAVPDLYIYVGMKPWPSALEKGADIAGGQSPAY